jgi:hypothetical protein
MKESLSVWETADGTFWVELYPNRLLWLVHPDGTCDRPKLALPKGIATTLDEILVGVGDQAVRVAAAIQATRDHGLGVDLGAAD